jgi:hypothetical protein
LNHLQDGHPDLKGFGTDGRFFFWLKEGRPDPDTVQVLRTVFRPSRGSLSQVIFKSYAPDVRIIDASESISSEADPGPIDLAECPPIRADLVRTREDNHTLRLSVHRILCDGLSMRLLLGEIGALYSSSLGGAHAPLPDPAIQYADYAAWERAWLTGETLAKQLAFWSRQRLKLIGAPVRFLAVARQSACSGVAGAGAACGK